MKIRIAQNELGPIATQVSRYVANPNSNPSLAGIEITTLKMDGQDRLKLTGFDGVATAKATAPVIVETPGTVYVQGAIFADIVRDLPPVELTLELVETPGGNQLLLTAGKGTYRIPLVDGDDSNPVPSMGSVDGTIEAARFSTAVGQVARVASKEQEKLTGVFVKITRDSMVLTSTDSYRLARRTIPWVAEGSAWEGKDADYSIEAYLPARIFAAAAALFAKGGMLKVSAGVNGTAFGIQSKDSAVIITKVEANTFPAVDRLFTTDFTHEAAIDVATLSAATKRVAKFAEAGKPISYTFSEGAISIKVEGGLGYGSEQIDADYHGEEFKIGYNPDYLIDGLSALGSERVEAKFNGNNRATTFVPEGDPDSFTYLLVPIQMN